jgi:hypothetical protein
MRLYLYVNINPHSATNLHLCGEHCVCALMFFVRSFCRRFASTLHSFPPKQQSIHSFIFPFFHFSRIPLHKGHSHIYSPIPKVAMEWTMDGVPLTNSTNTSKIIAKYKKKNCRVIQNEIPLNLVPLFQFGTYLSQILMDLRLFIKKTTFLG